MNHGIDREVPSETLSSRTTWIALASILGAILALRLWMLPYLADARFLGDENGFYRWARYYLGLLDSPPYNSQFIRVPGMSLFLAGAIQVVGEDWYSLRWVMVFISMATPFMAFVLARPHVGSRAALLAVLIVGIHPEMIHLSFLLLSEQLVIPLLLGSTALLLPASGSMSLKRAAAGGAVLGLSCLVKPIAVLFVPVLGLMILLRSGDRRPAFIRCTLVGGVFILMLTPWIIHNWNTHGEFIPLDTLGAQTLYMGNCPPEDRGQPTDAPLLTRGGSPGELASYYQQKAWKTIRSDPVSFLERSLYKTRVFWGIGHYVMHRNTGTLKEIAPLWMRRWTVFLCWTLTPAAIILGFLGFGAGREGRLGSFTLLLLILATVAQAITYAVARHRIPFLPFLIIPASYVVLNLRRVFYRLPGDPRIMLGAVAGVVYLIAFLFFPLENVPHYWRLLVGELE